MSTTAGATTTEMARDLTRRLATLGRAHDLIRPMPGKAGGEAALLGDIFCVLLAPYDDRGVLGDRIRVLLPEARVGERAATTLALLVHELDTNSVKYGFLVHVQRPSALKAWGLGLAQRLGFKRAAVAVARKIGVVLHAMWKENKPFEAWPGAVTAPAAA